MSNIFWENAVKEARELIASAEKSGHEYVGVQRARAIVAVDEELRELRKMAYPPAELHRPDGTIEILEGNGHRGIMSFDRMATLDEEVRNQ